MALVLCGIGVVFIRAAIRTMDFRSLVSVIFGLYLAFFMYYNVAFAEFEQFRGRRAFAQAVSYVVPKDKEVAFFPLQYTFLVYYLQVYHELKDYRQFEKIEEAHQALLQSGGFLLAEQGTFPEEKWVCVVQEKTLTILKRRKETPWGLYRPR
jgi:hypothetical protein